ncbi:SNARE domain protein [Ancylostoma duodenale]|uniref:SNARE domain protein n=1 Tax=Ancylostoma duodenale TaxID=51022 RepID=A0A0C2C672_9BILA|nr:SNARE domain protein [Ancylostoma duodenale]
MLIIQGFCIQQIIRDQDEDLVLVGKSVNTLKHMSYKIGDELDQQAVMLDDLGQEMDTVDTKLDGVMKKIAKLTHMDDGMLYLSLSLCRVVVALHLSISLLGKVQRFIFFSRERKSQECGRKSRDRAKLTFILCILP